MTILDGAGAEPATVARLVDPNRSAVPQGAQSIDRAAELMSLVIRSQGPISYTDLVESTGLARSTASRLLAALERNEILERTAEGLYRGGALFTHYATHFDRVELLAATAQPILERIGDATGETVNLGVPRGNTVVQVSQVDASFVLGAANWVEVDVPPHCSALGKVLYAYGAITVPKGTLEGRTPETVTDPDAFEDDLAEIRERGYAVALGELEEGLDALAAPVTARDGEVLAAMGLSGPSFRLEGRHDELGALLVDECGRLSRAVEHRSRIKPRR